MSEDYLDPDRHGFSMSAEEEWAIEWVEGVLLEGIALDPDTATDIEWWAGELVERIGRHEPLRAVLETIAMEYRREMRKPKYTFDQWVAQFERLEADQKRRYMMMTHEKAVAGGDFITKSLGNRMNALKQDYPEHYDRHMDDIFGGLT